MSITTEVVHVTPDIAQAFLKTARANRNISERTVSRYAKDMRAGRWHLNGEPLIFNQEGQLIDGRHRCTASMVSESPFDTVVVSGVKDDAFNSLNCGYKRILAHYLSIQGEKQCMVLAAAIRFCIEFEQDSLFLNYEVTAEQGLGWLDKNPEIRNYTPWSNRMTQLIQPSIGVGLLYEFSRIDKDEAELFFLDLVQGDNLKLNDPVLRLRKRLLDSRASQKARLTRRHLIALVIKAWNYRRLGKEVKLFTFQDNEQFPRPI